MNRLMLIAAAIGGLSSPASAATLKKVPAQLNPDKAYLLLEYEAQPSPYAGIPGSRKTVPAVCGLVFGRYDPALGDIRGYGKAKANPVPAKQKALELYGSSPIVKGPTSRLMLIEVEPDTWVVQACGDTSFSLGSYMFKAEPGAVIDLGVVETAADWAEGDHPPDMGDLMKMAFLGPFAKRPAVAPMRASFRERTASDIAIPDTIPTAQIRKVAFTADAKFGNYLGGLVNRIEGVNATLKKKGQAAPASSQSAAAPAPSSPTTGEAR